ncbi:hypothetical protein [Thalassolituus maritimus]|uniref:Uncharacterized protein n=1 Tax=Thalassolituus maritimus TaxID=484498 RepID=A0ABQ0A0B6_9GAMM
MELRLSVIFRHVSSDYLPGDLTQAGKVLLALAGGDPVSTMELIRILEADPRSAFQALRNESCGYWLINNLNKNKGRGLYQLSTLHLSGNPLDDAKARAIQKRELATYSKDLALSESLRLPGAMERLQEVMQEELRFD